MLNVIRIPGVEIFPGTDVKVKNPNYKGRRKYAREEKSSAEYSVDGELVRVERSIDWVSSCRLQLSLVDINCDRRTRFRNE